MRPEFRLTTKNEYWVVEVFGRSFGDDDLFGDWDFEEPFHESDYQRMAEWCAKTFKTWLTPRRARRMSFNQFYFSSKKDAEWFMLYWGGLDIESK